MSKMVYCGNVSGGHKCNLAYGHTGEHFHAGVGWTNVDSMADKISGLASSALTDGERLQVLIHLTARVAETVEALLACRISDGLPKKRRKRKRA